MGYGFVEIEHASDVAFRTWMPSNEKNNLKWKSKCSEPSKVSVTQEALKVSKSC